MHYLSSILHLRAKRTSKYRRNFILGTIDKHAWYPPPWCIGIVGYTYNAAHYEEARLQGRKR